MMKNILIVEESTSADLLYRKLFDEGDDWELSMCTSFQDGLSLLEEKSFDYIISDGLVQGSEISGLEFLARAQASSPESVRLFISGTITPRQVDYEVFSAYINKKNHSHPIECVKFA